MMQKVKKLFIESYQESPFSFWCETIETILLVCASAVLSFTILEPATWIFVPMYLVGSALGIISSVIRKAAMVIFLCSWFTFMNLIALIVLIMDVI